MPFLPEYLIEVPGTPCVVLKDDTRLGPWAVANGTIVGETSIAELPIVQALTPGDVVLDIGAFIGDTAQIFTRHGAEVWAFEPYPDAFEALRINCPGIHALNVAVGNGKPMGLTGGFGENNGNCGTRMMGTGTTPTIRIDDLHLPRVTFAKIDCEGMEPAVLDGMIDTLCRCKPALLIEVYDTLLKAQGYTRQDVFDRLAAAGYRWEVAIGRECDDRLDYLAISA